MMPADDALVLARVGAHIMNLLINELGLGQLAERYTGDDGDQWLVVSPLELRAVRHSKQVAEITFSYGDGQGLPYQADIVVTDAYLLLRTQHVREFDPAAHGITINQARDWRNEKRPDIDVSFQLEDIESQITGLRLPRRPIPRRQFTRTVRVKPSLRARR